MCGIAGYVGNKKLNDSLVQTVFKSMHHRGPNAKGFHSFLFGNLSCSFLHTRLSILDLNERSDQPFSYNGNCIVFNGELYNYIELRNKLKKEGYNFRTKGDTEVVIAAYEYYGEKCVDHFEGMWSFVIYDSRKNILFLSRDRFGEKPLLYFYNGKEFAFSSESKTLFHILQRSFLVNDIYIKNFLNNGFRWLFKGSHTPFKNINRVNSGENLIIDSNLNINQYKYWKPKFSENKLSIDDVVEGTRHYLNESIKLRMRSDVPIAFCLSGGIDSSSLVSITKNKINNNVHSFSIIDDDERYNESVEIDYLKKYLNINNYKTKLNPNNFFKELDTLIKHHNEPVFTISYFIHSLLQKEISDKGFKVAISGTGADELFAGYYDHSLYWLAETYSRNEINKKIEKWHNNIGKFIKNHELQNPFKFIENRSSREYLFDSNEVLDNLINKGDIENFKEEEYTDNLLKNRMANELLHEVVPVILDQDDKNSMMRSLENRSPFLDTNLVKFAYSIPTEYLYYSGLSKSILRSAVKDFLPDKIRLKKEKKGFNASIKTLLNLEDYDNKKELLRENPIFDYVHKTKFEDYLSLDQENPMFSKFLFRFISCKFFLEAF